MNQRRPQRDERQFVRGMRGGATAALVAVTLLVGVLTLRAAGFGDAGAASIAGVSQNQPHRAFQAGGAPVPTDTPTAVPTDTPLPAATATPIPPTPTPGPGLITFTCVSGAATAGQPTYFMLDVCLSTTPGAVVNVVATTCTATPYGVWSDIHVGASGAAENPRWTLQSTCGLPLTITLSASGSAPDGSALAGSTSFTIAG